jgi:hypothetical protein
MTRVVFLYHEANEDVFALFPDEINSIRGGSQFYMSYSHIGQHGDCSMRYVRECRMAQPNEYADLQYELKHAVGYELDVLDINPLM